MCLGIPSRVLSLEKNLLGMTVADVEAGGVVRRIRLDYLPDAEVGDYVMVQMGFAVSRISEEEAGDVFDALGQLVDLSPLDHDSLPTGTGAFKSVPPQSGGKVPAAQAGVGGQAAQPPVPGWSPAPQHTREDP